MDNNFFNNRLRELRKERNLTQAQVANALGIKLSTYSHMENDGKRPSPDILQRIARLFLVSVDNLTGESENTSKQGLPYVIHETPPLVFHQHYGFFDETINRSVQDVNLMRDLKSVEQDMILCFRVLSEEDKAKVIKYIKRAHKNSIENDDKKEV